MGSTSRWWISIAQAKAVQERLRYRVERTDRFEPLTRVTGVDVGVARGQDRIRAAVAVLAYPELDLIESSVAIRALEFPYVPGYLSFRELPVVMTALDALTTAPGLLLCDGQGLAHPRRFGLASHVGVVTGLPSIGVAKSRLIGSFGDVPRGRGEWTPLLDPDAGDETIGAVVRSRATVKPIFVSIGHRISLPRAVEVVMRCVTRYRLPETTRAAHALAACERSPRRRVGAPGPRAQ